MDEFQSGCSTICWEVATTENSKTHGVGDDDVKVNGHRDETTLGE